MTREDTQKLLVMINAIYPNWKVENPQETIAAWHWALEDYPPEMIKAALHVYIKTDNTGFPPSASQLIGCMYKPMLNGIIDEAEAWHMVKKAIADSAYGAQEHFDEMPPLVQKAVGKPNNLREWGMCETEYVNTVVMSNFQRNYRTLVQREEFNTKVNPQAMELLKSIGQNNTLQIGGKLS